MFYVGKRKPYRDPRRENAEEPTSSKTAVQQAVTSKSGRQAVPPSKAPTPAGAFVSCLPCSEFEPTSPANMSLRQSTQRERLSITPISISVV